MTSNLLNGQPLTLASLSQSDEAAFQLLLTPMLKIGVDPSIFDYTDVTARENKETSIVVRVSKERAKVDKWVYRDTQTLIYNRVDVDELTAKYGKVIYTDFPATTNDVFAKYLTKLGFFNRGHVVLNESVDHPGAITLTVGDGSFLLVGSSEFVIKQAPKELAEIIRYTELNLFDPSRHMSGVAKDILVEEVNLINADYIPRDITPNEIQFSVPVVTNEYDLINTEVVMSNYNGEVFMGAVTLTYHRVNFAWLYQGTQLVISGPTRPTTSYLLTRIKAITGFDMELSDLVDQVYDLIPIGELSTITVVVDPSSLRYVGEITIDYTAV